MKRMRASTFKKHCLTVIRSVQATGESIIVTNNGKPVAKIVPAEPEADELFGFMAGKIKIVGDIEAPTGAWKVAKKFPNRRITSRHK